MALYPNTIYALVNARFFGGRLPKVRVYWMSDEEMEGALGRTWLLPEGKMKIELNDRYKKESRIWGFTLLHEMAHVEQFCTHPRSTHHGRIWQGIMKRLANDGAFAYLW